MNHAAIAGSTPRVKTASTQPLPEIEELRIAGTCPFGSGDSDPFLAQAFALLTVLAQSYEIADDAGGQTVADYFSINPRLVSDALTGISSLIGLAQHVEDVRLAKEGGRR
ncbi:hypothetical protein [Sphingobium phenoxybenzoativorans]|uniref:hypothetical protein n=1 Tax=Sphingobium phenoxybenzoativorans TaxID=1592790 RepID=UPI0008732276|nr:hypothetical protein [Sphingobium phenoxybenzoativorans]